LSGLNKSFKNVKDRYNNIKDVYKNVLLTLIIALITLFIGLELIFLLSGLISGDIVAAYLAALGQHNPSPAIYAQMKHLLGLDLPFFQRFWHFLAEMLTGDWHISVSLVRGQPVFDLISDRAFESIGLSIIPTIIGIILGILVGKLSYRNRGRWKDKIIQLFTTFCLAIPIFFLGMSLQYTLGYEMNLFDPRRELNFLPLFCMTFGIFAIVSNLVRSYLADNSRKKSIVSNTIITGKILGFFIMFMILVENTFGLRGLGGLLWDAILNFDYYVLTALLFVFLTTFVILTLISNMFSFCIDL
jgi:ABC-type dipeptide/oligopeptide/nickel transport system permease component